MKKRFKVIIGISAFCTVAGLFASLVFCALNAFPELLENEIQNNETADESFNIATKNNYVEAQNNKVVYENSGKSKGFTPSFYDAHNIVIHNQSSTKENDKVIIESAPIVESAKKKNGKEHLSGFYEYRNEVVVVKEKANAINVSEEDDHKVLECTLLVLVIVQALGFVVLQHRDKEPQIECFESRENHQD